MNSFAQDGALDPDFDFDGIVTTSIGSSHDIGNTVVVQSDDKIVVAGNSGNNLALTRYNKNGSLDLNFGTQGIVITNLGCANASGSSLLLQNDGKLVVGGYCGIFPNYDFAITRYLNNGLVDPSFGTAGTAITPILSAGDQGFALAIQNDGKLLLGGMTSNGSNSDMALIRYTTNGQIDQTFGTSGKVITPVGIANDIIRSIAMQADDKILVAGFSYVASSFSYDFILARFHSDGSLDNSFGKNGIVTTAFIHNTNDYGENVTIQADGKILVGGYSYNGFLLVARYLADGQLDPEFGIKGLASIPFGCAYSNDYSLALQEDGKILLAGYNNTNATHSDFAITRLDQNGSIDPSFGANGMARTPIGNLDDVANSIAIQKDGKIVVAGKSNNGINFDFAVLRYNNNKQTVITKNLKSKIEISYYPNPFTSELILSTKNSFNNATLILKNAIGENVIKISNISGNSFSLQKGNLPCGFYFAYLEQDHGVIATMKLLISK